MSTAAHARVRHLEWRLAYPRKDRLEAYGVVFDCTNLRSGAVLRARCKIAKAIRKIGLRARNDATYGRSVRAGA